MNSFGLGLVLNFVDNATAGMGNATRAFQQMSQTADAVSSSVSTSITDIVTASYALDSVGTTLMNAGSSIISLYGNVSQSVIDAGMEMQGYRMTLSALYGDIDAGNAKLEEIKDYAAHSVFEIQSLIPAVTTMKAVGIEAMDEITTSSGKNTQKLLDYASDLAAMMPNMRNAYGTGVSAAMGAFKEYIAEGNALSLKRGAGLDITGLLGEDKGATIEERTQQVADLIEVLNIAGHTKNLENTPTQQLSNLQDTLFNTLTKIADSGVFEKYCNLLSRASEWVRSLYENEDTFNTITGILADTVGTLLTPLESLLSFIIENSNAIIAWIKEHPKLTKNILLTVAAVGAFLVVGGAFLKLVSSIGLASSGLKFLSTLPTILSTLGTSFGGLIAKASPFVALAALAYYAWTENLFGIRDTVTSVMGDIGSIFSLIGSAWDDNTLTGEEFQKANDMGILPLIEGILQLRYYWDFLVAGFKEGFSSFFQGIADTLNQLGIMDVDIMSLVSSFGEFLDSLVEVGAEDKWSTIGEVVGKITAAVVALAVIINVCKPIISIVSLIGKAFGLILTPIKWIGSLLKIAFNPLKDVFNVLKGGQGTGFFTKLLEVIVAVTKGGMGLKDAMTIVFGGTGTVIMGVISFIGGLVMAAKGFIEQLTNGFSWFWEIIKWIGLALAAVGAVILGIVGGPMAAIIAAVIGVATTIVVLVKQYWNEICAFFSTIGGWIYKNVIQPIAKFFSNLWNDVYKGATSFISKFVNAFNTAISNIKNFFNQLPSFFKGVWDRIVEVFTNVGIAISDAISGAVKSAVNSVLSKAVSIINGFIGAINSVISVINAIPGVSIGYLSELSVPQLAEGGVVDRPTLAQIGEKGKEAVVPLKNNDEWTSIVADKIAPKLAVQQPTQGKAVEEHNDYSVTFAPGSVVIQLANATEAELEKAAEKLMKIIERKQQLKAMAVRA